MVYQGLQRSQAVRSLVFPLARVSTTTIYSFAIIIEPVDNSQKERHSLTAYFKEPPFRFEIEEWAHKKAGNDYRVADYFLLEEINL